MKFFWMIVCLFIIGFLLEKFINKLLGVKKKKIPDALGRRIGRWGRGILVIVFLVSFTFIIGLDRSVIKWFWIFYLAILMGFQAFLEWKYIKSSKQYISTLIPIVWFNHYL